MKYSNLRVYKERVIIQDQQLSFATTLFKYAKCILYILYTCTKTHGYNINIYAKQECRFSLKINNWIKNINIWNTRILIHPWQRYYWLFCIFTVCSAIPNKSLLLCQKNKLYYSKLFFLCYALKNHLFFNWHYVVQLFQSSPLSFLWKMPF